MSIQAIVKTVYGEERDLYIRLISAELNNHGEKSTALFRGFTSKEAFENKSHYVYEHGVEFIADVSEPLWEQAYNELKKELNHGFVDV